MAARIAIASMDGTYIDQHFGSARYWQIYEMNDKAEFIETRKTAAMCKGCCEDAFSQQVLLLHDCDAVLVSKIGSAAAGFMIGRGKRVFEAAGEVKEALIALEQGYFTHE